MVGQRSNHASCCIIREMLCLSNFSFSAVTSRAEQLLTAACGENASMRLGLLPMTRLARLQPTLDCIVFAYTLLA
jgi:hypothetical protein